jgi:hypothetical protein
MACPTQPLMPSGGRRTLREGVKSRWRSSPSYRPRALSCAFPLLIHHGQGIICLRGCGSLLSATSRWP